MIQMAEQDNFLQIEHVQSDLRPTPQFKELVNTIPKVVERGDQLLKQAINEDVDEQEFDYVTQELKPVQKYKKQIEKEIKAARKRFNDERDFRIGQIKEVLENAGYDELERIDKEIKNNKKLILNKRQRERWNELEDHFNQLLENTYPKLKEHVPEFSFNMFYNAHPKFVSGAKTKKVTDKMRSEVANYLDNFNKDIETILAMNSPFEQKLIRTYLTTEDMTATIQSEQKFKEAEKKEQQRREEQFKREKERIERENKKKEKAAKLQNKKAEQTSTENIDKLKEIYDIMQSVITNGINEDESRKAIQKIKDIVGD